MVKRQLDVRRKVYKQKIQISGKAKSTDALLSELLHIIKKHSIEIENTHVATHQQLSIVFEKPSFLVGCKIRHQFEEGQVLTWYHGDIVSYKKQQFQVHYPESNEMCTFSLAELQNDFYAGDLWFQ